MTPNDQRSRRISLSDATVRSGGGPSADIISANGDARTLSVRPAAARARDGLLHAVAAGVRENAVYLVTVGCYAACVAAARVMVGRTPLKLLGAEAVLLWGWAALIAAVQLLGALIRARMSRVHRNSPARIAYAAAWRAVRASHLSRRRLVSVCICLAVAPLAMSAYMSGRQLIPDLHPFAWDARLAEWDYVLHGGRDAWRLVSVLTSEPWVGAAATVFYHPIWMPVVISVALAQLLAPPSPRRTQALVSLVLTMGLVGTFAAIALSAAGPIYFVDVGGSPDRYSELLAALDRGHLELLREGQRALWAAQVQGGGPGVTAMPSMHVGYATYVALVGIRRSAAAGLLGIAFLVATLAVSVALGWHYAVDGYVAIPLVAGLWWVGARLAAIPETDSRRRGAALAP